jgi:hypothetical protein
MSCWLATEAAVVAGVAVHDVLVPTMDPQILTGKESAAPQTRGRVRRLRPVGLCLEIFGQARGESVLVDIGADRARPIAGPWREGEIDT